MTTHYYNKKLPCSRKGFKSTAGFESQDTQRLFSMKEWDPSFNDYPALQTFQNEIIYHLNKHSFMTCCWHVWQKIVHKGKKEKTEHRKSGIFLPRGQSFGVVWVAEEGMNGWEGGMGRDGQGKIRPYMEIYFDSCLLVACSCTLTRKLNASGI